MIFNLILIVVIVVSILVLGLIIFKKIPQLRIVDPSSSPEEKGKNLKHQIIRKRIERAGGKHVERISTQVVKPIGMGLQNIFRRIAGKLTAVERRYQERQKKTSSKKLNKKVLAEMVEEGKKFMADDLCDSAEKKFIEVIGADPKHIDAYENLGRLYLHKKNYEDAKSTFQFLLKLSPNDPSVTAYLGEVAEKIGDNKAAMTYLQRAVDLSPKNPKYLDLFINSAINNRDVHEAMSALDRLKEVNPENGKISSFEEKIEKIRKF